MAEELEYGDYRERTPTPLQERFVPWIKDKTGYDPNTDAKNRDQAFAAGVRLAVSLRIPFQASPENREATEELRRQRETELAEARTAREKEREERRAEKEKAAEERRAAAEERAAAKGAKAAAPAKAAPEPPAEEPAPATRGRRGARKATATAGRQAAF